jgi:DNA-directed RNA polymerase alpha subunit
MPLFIVPEWLQRRKILKTELIEVQELFGDKQDPVLGDLTVDLLKQFYHSRAKVDFFKVVRVLGFYGIHFSGKLSGYSCSPTLEPEILSVAFNHREKKITDYIDMPSSALLKSLGIEMLGQLNGVPITSLKKILDCTSFVDDFFSIIPSTVVPATPDVFLPVKQKGSVQQITYEHDEETESILHQSINILNLSVRPYNCLISKGIATIGDLVRFIPEELVKTKNFGRKSLREISDKLSQYKLQLGSDTEETTLVNQIELTEEQYNIPLKELNLSVRATNCLQESKIITVGQLIQFSSHDLLGLPNLGKNTLAELMEKITSVQTNRTMPTQLSLFSVNNKIGVNLDDKKVLAGLSTSINNLILSVRTRKVLNDQKIDYVWQAVQLTEKNILKFNNFGRKSLSELKETFLEFGLHLGVSFTPEQIEKIQSFEVTVSTQELDARAFQIIGELGKETITFLSKRENQIVHERLWPKTVKKRTLEDIALDWSVSRERIRQIEKKALKKILQQYRKDINDIVETITQKVSSCENLAVISLLPLHLYTANLCKQRIVTELFLLVNENLFFDWEYDLISGKGEKWIDQLCHSIRKNVCKTCEDKLFSEKILSNAVAHVISHYKLNNTKLIDPLINKVIEGENITSSGGVLCFGKMTKQDKIVLAFENCFPEGLKIHKKDEFLLKTLQEYDSKTYRKTSPRSVVARLADHPDIFLWGRGFYVHRKTVTYNSNLVERAADWIIHRFDKGHPKFQIDLPFDYFKEEMMVGGIPNEYALYTLIRTLENDRIGQRKFPSLVDQQSEIDIFETVVEELENYLFIAKRAISATDLKREFVENRGWKDYRLQLQLSSHSENIYPWLNHSYIHLEYLQINYDKLDELIEAIQNKLETIQGTYSLKGAKQELQVLWHQVCPDAPIPTMVKLIRSVSSTDLEINHYLVSLRNDEEVGTISLAAEIEDYFLKENREVSTLELKKEFQEIRGWSDPQYYGAIRKSYLFRMSKTSFVHPSTIDWNSKLYEEVHAVLSENLQNKNNSGVPHIILSEIIDKYLLPELPNGIEWTIELLISIGGEHNNFLFFDDACTFVGNQFEIEDLDDMIAFLISQSFEYNLEKQKKVERLLWREGIIASGRAIPKNEVFFPESSLAYLPDSDEITLSQIGAERYGSKKPA